MRIAFTKMQSIGNDFIVIDTTKEPMDLPKKLIQSMSDRHFGIGFDQLLMLAPSTREKAQFNYRIFNANGQEVEQCGNGARCMAKYIRDQGYSQAKQVVLAAKKGLLTLNYLDNEQFSVNIGRPYDLIAQDTLTVSHQQITLGTVNVGNPHAVIWVDDVDIAPVEHLGKKLQRHPKFPDGVNVGFVQKISPGEIRLRVFERGAGETLGCGSGACAAVAIAHALDNYHSLVTVRFPGGSVAVQYKDTKSPIYLIGTAETVFTGIWT